MADTSAATGQVNVEMAAVAAGGEASARSPNPLQRVSERPAMGTEAADESKHAPGTPNDADVESAILPSRQSDREYSRGEIMLQWRDLGLKVRINESANEAKKERVILHDVTGEVGPGEMLAVMGPSGAGKSTFLNLLAGRIPRHEGQVLVNGEKPTDAFKRVSGYVTQDTVYFQSLTVREVLRYGAELSISSTTVDRHGKERPVTLEDKYRKVDKIIEMLDIEKCADSRIGVAADSGGISGGERRRLAVGMELLCDPSLLFLDEPTSGLDAASAVRIVNILRKLATRDRRTIICTIHQPRASILPMFDKLLLLADGGTAYYGPTWTHGRENGLLAYLRQAGVPCPPFENPADHVLDIVDPLFDVPELRSVRSGSIAASRAGDPSTPAVDELGNRDAVVAMLQQKYNDSEVSAHYRSLTTVTPPAIMDQYTSDTPTGWWNQMTVVFRRSFFYKLREPSAVLTQFVNAVVLSIIIGLIYWQMNRGQAALLDRVAAVSFVVMCQSFMAIDLIVLFPIERSIYLRDQASGLYQTSSFYLGRSLAETPFHLLFGFLVGVITYVMMGLQSDWEKFWVYTLDMTLITNTGVAFLLFVGSVSRTMEQGNLLGTLMLILLTLFNGFFVNKNNIPIVFRWLGDISFLGWGVEVAVSTELEGLELTCTAQEVAEGACITTGEVYLARLGMDNVDKGWLLFLIFLESVVFRVVAFLALHFLYTGEPFRHRLKSLR